MEGQQSVDPLFIMRKENFAILALTKTEGGWSVEAVILHFLMPLILMPRWISRENSIPSNPQVGAVPLSMSARDERIMTLDTHAGGRVNICPLDCRKYLISIVPNTILGDETSNLYLWEAGKLMHLMNGCLNRRLRRMYQLRKWKRAGGV